MAYKDLRDWMATLEDAGELRRIKAEVDWELELGAIARRVLDHDGPALLFESLKGYHDTTCRKLFTNGLGSRGRVAMALGLQKETSYRAIIQFIKERLGRQMAPAIVSSAPVKQNIIKGDRINLFEFPVPKFAPLDGGRYINTMAAQVSMDPETRLMNVGMYRGMVGEGGKSIPALLAPSRHWGHHFLKYKKQGEEMPVAVVYGCDPTLLMYAGSPIIHRNCSEYDLLGGLRNAPVELVKCETSDLYVPASAEIVVEGRISADPNTFEKEGPFGEYPGFYAGMSQRRHTIRVECVTHRDNPIFEGGIEGSSPGHVGESTRWSSPMRSAIIWKALEDTGIPNITGVWGPPITTLANLRVSIDKIYRGHAKQVAAGVWGLQASSYVAKNLIVVDKDIDIFDDDAVQWALAYRTNADMGAFQFFSGTPGGFLDPSVPLPQRDSLKYGHGKWTRVFIDATVNWDLEPEAQYGGRREPPLCTETSPETAELIERRWPEYGI